MQSLVSHHLIQAEIPPQTGAIADYLVGSNGIFIRSRRDEFSATIPWQLFHQPLPNLKTIEPRFDLHIQRVPAELLQIMIETARSPQPFVEMRFYLVRKNAGWSLVQPDQIGSASSVKLVDPYDPVHQQGVIEVHSHPPGANQFSSIDDQNANGFRIYGVLTDLDTTPKIQTRVGIEQKFLALQPEWIFEEVG